MMFERTLSHRIQAQLFQGHIIVLYGARQVGKTTLCKDIQSHYPESHYITCDDPTVVQNLAKQGVEHLRRRYGKHKLLIIDEAQRVENIGITLKLFADHLPEVQIIATGSSSFDLANRISEPLTGRAMFFHLYPLSMAEISTQVSFDVLAGSLPDRILYGMYPHSVLANNRFDLTLLSEQYLYKDVLIHQDIKKSPLLFSLLQALALQLGSEVSYNELAGLLGVDTNTVIKYIRLLEQSFVIFGLHSLTRNMRNELKRAKKYYFRDTGIRNGLLQNFTPLHLRNDTGALRENFIITERIKHLHNQGISPHLYFRRTTTQQEIDYIEEYDGALTAYEIKRNPNKKVSYPASFLQAYPGTQCVTITPETFWDIIDL